MITTPCAFGDSTMAEMTAPLVTDRQSYQRDLVAGLGTVPSRPMIAPRGFMRGFVLIAIRFLIGFLARFTGTHQPCRGRRRFPELRIRLGHVAFAAAFLRRHFDNALRIACLPLSLENLSAACIVGTTMRPIFWCETVCANLFSLCVITQFRREAGTGKALIANSKSAFWMFDKVLSRGRERLVTSRALTHEITPTQVDEVSRAASGVALTLVTRVS